MKPGSQVICIDDNFAAEVARTVPNLPEYGSRYTVRDIVPDPLGINPPGITLEGLVNPLGWTPCTHGFVLIEFKFLSTRFRLITEDPLPDWEEAFNIEKPLPSIHN